MAKKVINSNRWVFVADLSYAKMLLRNVLLNGKNNGEISEVEIGGVSVTVQHLQKCLSEMKNKQDTDLISLTIIMDVWPVNCMSNITQSICYLCYWNVGKESVSEIHRRKQFVGKWKEITSNGDIILAAFLNLKRTFETIDRGRLTKQKLFGCNMRVIKWFEGYLEQRKQRTKVNGTTSSQWTYKMTLVVPQEYVFRATYSFYTSMISWLCV